MKKLISHWLPFVLYLGLVYFFSTRPRPLGISVDMGFLHPIEFFILAFLLLRVVYSYNAKYAFTLTILIVAGLAIMDEIIQFFTPGRISSLTDVGLDLIGALFILVFKNKKLGKILGNKYS